MALPTAPDTLVVSQIAPSTIVGDGPLAGWRCAMIRLGGCNLACTWCDVPFAWDGSQVDLSIDLTLRLVRNVVEEALSANPRLVLITGGEPLLQQRNSGWTALLAALREHGVETELHTNGTIAPTMDTAQQVHRFVVSPKLSHSGEPTWTRIRPEALEAWADLARAGQVAFSFVVRDRIWISPEGTTRSRVLDVTADVAGTTVDHGFNLATRIGVLVAGSTAAVA